jgi:hypothetical protein
MAGEVEDPDSAAFDHCPCCRPGIADQVRNPDTTVAVSQKVKSRKLSDHRLEPLYPF